MGADLKLMSDNQLGYPDERYYICIRLPDGQLMFWSSKRGCWQSQPPKQYFRYLVTAYDKLEILYNGSAYVAHSDGSRANPGFIRHSRPTGAKLTLVN